MRVEMELQVKFNRNVDLDNDYIVPGGYEMIMNGKNVQFDFHYTRSGISNEDAFVVVFSIDGADYEAFPGFKKVSVNDLQNISSIKECFVYTGEPGESDLEVVSIEKITFILPGGKPWAIDVARNLIDEFNATLQPEREKEQRQGMYELKCTPSKLKEKIMAQQMSICSRFLDIPSEDLCGYTKEQLEDMVGSTIEQMPEELLGQFEIELADGRRGV